MQTATPQRGLAGAGRWLPLVAVWLAAGLAFSLARPSHVPVDDGESAYRLRLAALTLATGSLPAEDRFIGRGEATPVPWPMGVHGLWAFALRRVVPAVGERAARGELGDRELAQSARAFDRWSFGAALLAAGWAAWAWARERSRPVAAGICVLTVALAALAGRGAGGVLAPDAALALLTFVLAACVGSWARVSSTPDVALVQLVAGLTSGVLLQVSAVGWLVVASLAVLFARPFSVAPNRRARADRGRTWTLFWLGCGAVLLLPARPLGSAVPWPEWSRGVSGWLAGPPWAALPAVAWGAALVAELVSSDKWSPERTWLWILAGSYVLLSGLDARFAPVALALIVVSVACVVSRLAGLGRQRATVGVALVAVVALALRSGWASGGRPDALPYAAGLRALRESTPSPGPWNHPLARSVSSVLCNPVSAGNVAFHGRRPVPAAAFDGVAPTQLERVVARLLLSSDEEALVAGALHCGSRYIAVAARDLLDRAVLERLAGEPLSEEAWRASALVRLACGEPFGELERIDTTTELTEVADLGRDVPVFSVYRVPERPATWSD